MFKKIKQFFCDHYYIRSREETFIQCSKCDKVIWHHGIAVVYKTDSNKG